MNCKNCKVKDKQIEELKGTYNAKTKDLKATLNSLKITLKDTINKQTELLKNVSSHSNNLKLTDSVLDSLESFSDVFIDLCMILHERVGKDKDIETLVAKLVSQMSTISELTTEAARLYKLGGSDA